MSEQDPPRLLDTGDDYLRQVLQAGRREAPDETRLAALAAKLGPLVGGGAAGGGATGGGGALATKAAAAKVATVGTAKIIGAALLSATLVVASAVYVPKMVGSTRAVTATATSTAISTATPTAAVSLPTLDSPSESAIPAPPRKAASAAVESPDAEVKLLERAQDALRTDPAEALALAGEHARRFPRGDLAQEREIIAIEALTRTGHMDDARARADRFAAAYPRSTHLRRIEALVGKKF